MSLLSRDTRALAFTAANRIIKPFTSTLDTPSHLSSFQTYARVAVRHHHLTKCSGLFDGLNAAIKARETCPAAICLEQLFLQQIRNLDLPEPLLHWFHPIAMSIVLFAMGGFGAYLGYMLRTEPQGEVAQKARQQHPIIMGLMTFFFLLGSQGGLGAMLLFEKPLAESAHATTGGLALVLLTIQALIGGGLMGQSFARSVHAYLGGATMMLLVAHFIGGLVLGFSF